MNHLTNNDSSLNVSPSSFNRVSNQVLRDYAEQKNSANDDLPIYLNDKDDSNTKFQAKDYLTE